MGGDTSTDSNQEICKESKSQVVKPASKEDKKEDSKFLPGVLEITVKKASELVNNDRIGKSDPYVKIRHGDTEFRSKTIQNTLEPEWNFSCKFDIPNLEEQYIHINVYDDDFGKDNIEGCYSLSIKEAISDLPEEGCWYNLVGCKTGKVFICTSFTPIQMEDMSTVKPVKEIEAENISENVLGGEMEERKDSITNVLDNNTEESKEKPEIIKLVTDKESMGINKSELQSPTKIEKTKESSENIDELSMENKSKTADDQAALKIETTPSDLTMDKVDEIKQSKSESPKKTFENDGLNDLSKNNQAKSVSDAEIDQSSPEKAVEVGPGLLKITVSKASELVNKDMIGKSDPFVKIKFNGQEFKSKKVRNSLNPEWNFSADLNVETSTGDEQILLEVFDDDFGSENFIGSYTLSLNEAIEDTDKGAMWHNLSHCKTGKIMYSTIYYPDEELKKIEDSSNMNDNSDNKHNDQTIDQKK